MVSACLLLIYKVITLCVALVLRFTFYIALQFCPVKFMGVLFFVLLPLIFMIWKIDRIMHISQRLAKVRCGAPYCTYIWDMHLRISKTKMYNKLYVSFWPSVYMEWLFKDEEVCQTLVLIYTTKSTVLGNSIQSLKSKLFERHFHLSFL